MNFELDEIVPVNDAEKVLQVLEQHLRGVAAEVVRSNGQITAYGIGPSPRIVNKRDTTVVAASSVDGVTKLTAHVNYQASALLGNSPQNEIVKAKIEKALDEMRAELKNPRPWIPRMDAEPEQHVQALAAENQPPVTPKAFSHRQENRFEKAGMRSGVKAGFTAPTAAASDASPKILEAFPAADAARAEAVPTARAGEVTEKKRPADGSGSRSAFTSSLRKAFSSGSRPANASGSRPAFSSSSRQAAPSGSGSSPGRSKFASSASQAAALAPATSSEIAARKTIEALPAPVAEIITAKSSKKLAFHEGVDRRTGPQTPAGLDGVKRAEKRRIAPMVEVPLRGLMRAQGMEVEDAVIARSWWKIVLAAVALIIPMTVVAAYELRGRIPGGDSWRSNLVVWSNQMRQSVPLLRETYRIAESAANATPINGGASEAAPASAPLAAPNVEATPDTNGAAPSAKAEPVAAEPTALATPWVSPKVGFSPKRMVRPEKTLYLWTRDWAWALTSRDPAAQASYYADKVSQYLSQTGVTHDAVLLDKTASILARGPEWNVTVDRVYIVSESATGAKLRAVKHTHTKDASGRTTDTAVKIRLTVVRVRDLWKIVEEQETGNAETAAVKAASVSAKRAAVSKRRRATRRLRHG